MADGIDFEAVFRAGPSPTAVLSPDFVIVDVNDAYVRTAGRPRSALVGRNLFEAFPDDPEAARAVRASLDHVLATGERNVMALLRFDVAVPGRPGEVEPRYWSPVNVPVLNDDGTVRLILHRAEEVTGFLRELGLPRDHGAAAPDSERHAVQAEVYARSKELESTNQRLVAATDITMALLAEAPSSEVLELIALRAKQIADADQGFVLLREGDRFVVVAEAGAGDGGAVDEMTSLAVDVQRTAGPQVRGAGVPGAGVAVAVPLSHDEGVRGVLAVGNSPGKPGLGSATIQLLEPFAAQAKLALELSDRRRDTARLLVLEDRDRIARDLDRSVVNRLFQLGLELSSAADLITRDEPARRVRGVVTALDSVVQELQSAVFRSGGVRPDDRTFRARIHDLLDHAAESQGFATTSRLDHRLDGALDERAEQHLIAVLSELLVGDVRDRGAQVSVSIGLHPDPDPVCVLGEIEIDGIALNNGTAELGWAALARRAVQLGGSLTMTAGHGGRRFTWQMPLRHAIGPTVGAGPST